MIKTILSKIAPTLASALLGPFGGVAKNFMAKKLGLDELPSGGKLDKFLDSFLDTPENLQKMKEIENEFKLEMEKLEIDVFKLEVDDRKSARELASNNAKPQIILSALFIVVYFCLLISLFWAEVDPHSNPGMYQMENGDWAKQGESLIDLFQILLGVLTAGVAQILNFWFGGSMNKRTDAGGK